MIHLLIVSDSSIVFQRPEKSVFHGELTLTCRVKKAESAISRDWLWR